MRQNKDCKQKDIDFVDNRNIIGEHLGSKKIHLNKRVNFTLAKNGVIVY